MFGRGGRDGKPSTCVMLYRASSVKGKGVDPGLKLLLKKDGCIRRKFCQLLESTFSEDDQEDHFCCSCCDYDPVDPNGFFVFSAAKSTDAGTRKRRAAASVENLRDPKTAVDKDVLAGQLAEWRAQKAVECGLTCLGEEAVATNHMMEKIIDQYDRCQTVDDIVALGMQPRIAPSLLHALAGRSINPETPVMRDLLNKSQ